MLKEYMVSLVNLYGIVEKKKLVQIYNSQNNKTITIDDVEKFINSEEFLELYIGETEEELFDLEFEDIELKYLRVNQKNKPYYIPKQVELLKYSDDLYFEKTKEYRELLAFIQRYVEKNSSKASYLCEHVVLSIQELNNDLNYVLTNFSEEQMNRLHKKKFEKLVYLVVNLFNNTRIKENRGYSPQNLPKASYLA